MELQLIKCAQSDSLSSVELPKSFTNISGIDKRAFRDNPVKPTLLTESKSVVDAYNSSLTKRPHTL